MILFDVETTGLVEPEAAPLSQQPRIIEFAAIKYNIETIATPFEEDRVEFKCNPGIPLPEIITKITGLTTDDVKDEKPFAHYYPTLCDFFLGEENLIAHNVKFDTDLLRFDLMRIGKLWQFPWPKNHICTVQNSMSLKGYRLRLDQLHVMATGEPHEGAHRAMADVEALFEVVKWMMEEGLIKL